MPSFFIEYLSPTNPIASGIVTILQLVFVIWFFVLIVYGIWLFRKCKQIKKNEDVQPLVVARQERDLGQKDNDTNITAEEVFRDFCEKQKLHNSPSITKHLRKIIPLKADFSITKHLRKFFPQRKDSSITKHLKTIFLAGWDESRLEVSELVNHTTSNLFRWNSLFRSVLAVFIVIGLLGTLFGLTDSLTDLSPALKESTANETSTENSERMTQALGNLMDDVKGAFAPSIWGIIFTVLGVILYGIYLQIACHPVKSILERLTLTVWVPQLYPTTSQKLIQTLHESEAQMRSGYQTASQVGELVENVQGNISEFNENLKQANAITLPLSDSATQINKAASQINSAADVLSKGFTESLGKFSQEFATNVTRLTGFQDEIRSLHQQFQEASNQKLDQQNQKLDVQTQNLVIVLDALKSYEDAYIESRGQIDETLQKFINVATETNISIHESNREWFEKINTDIHEGNREWFEKINTKYNEQISEIQGQMETYLTVLQQSLENELKTLADVLSINLKNVQGSLDERLEVLNNRLENFDTPLKEVVLQFRETLETQLTTLNDRLNNFDKPLREAVDQIRETFDTQLETLNNRLENFDDPLKQAAEQMRGTFADLVTHMRTIVGDLQRKIIEQNDRYEEQLIGVKNLNQDIVNLLNQLDESSKNQKDAVNALSTNVNGLTKDINSLDTAINTFTSDSGDLSQSIGAIKGDIEKLGTASQQFVEKVEKADVTPLTTSIEKLNTSINEISKHSQTLANVVERLARQEGASASRQKTKRSSFKSKLNPFPRIWPFKKTKNENDGK